MRGFKCITSDSPRHAPCGDRPADRFLVEVGRGGVDQAVAGADGVDHAAFALLRIGNLEDAVAEEWLDLRRAAVRLIEGSNLLMMPGRAAAPAGTKSEVPGVELEPAEIVALIKKSRKSFDAFAKALRVLGWDALRATESKNAVLLMEIGSRMQDVCESCHKAFWYPNEKLP